MESSNSGITTSFMGLDEDDNDQKKHQVQMMKLRQNQNKSFMKKSLR